MTVTGPDFLALQVRDLARSTAFYADRLGMRTAAFSPPGAVVFDTAPIPFAVRDPLPGVDLDTALPRPGTGVVLWLRDDDPQGLHDRLVDSGVPVLVAPFDGPFGRTFTVADPDGYAITLRGDT